MGYFPSSACHPHGCITDLEKYIDERLESSFQPIARSFAIINPCPAGRIPQATVSANADINFACIEEGIDDGLDFIRINGSTVVLEAVQ